MHHQGLAFEQRLLNGDLRRGRGVLGIARVPDVGHVQERRALQADVDERGLHARKHAHNLTEVDVADQPARECALDVELLNGGLLDDGHARFLRRDIDEDVFGHGDTKRAGFSTRLQACPAPEACLETGPRTLSGACFSGRSEGELQRDARLCEQCCRLEQG